MIRPEDSWTYRVDGDMRREHHFRNLLAEYAAAIRLGDETLENYVLTEIIQVYKEANRCHS